MKPESTKTRIFYIFISLFFLTLRQHDSRSPNCCDRAVENLWIQIKINGAFKSHVSEDGRFLFCEKIKLFLRNEAVLCKRNLLKIELNR